MSQHGKMSHKGGTIWGKGHQRGEHNDMEEMDDEFDDDIEIEDDL
jgi:hypothetical protein